MLFPAINRRGHFHSQGLRYKHKAGRSWVEVHADWEVYRARLRSLDGRKPAMTFSDDVRKQIGTDITQYRGTRYKQWDDLLDGILCAYLAYWFWHWGEEGTMVIGYAKTGV